MHSLHCTPILHVCAGSAHQAPPQGRRSFLRSRSELTAAPPLAPLAAKWQIPDDHITFSARLTPDGRGGWKDKVRWLQATGAG